MEFRRSFQQLLRDAGPGRMASTAYDTAWVARIGDLNKPLSETALEWLCEHQLPDGSWGAKEVFYYHDRVICTLAALIALTRCDSTEHKRQQIERGKYALEWIVNGATQGLSADPSGATIGFELIIPTLLAEAVELGIIPFQEQRILGRLARQREIKLTKLQGLKINRYVSTAFSAEMAGSDGIEILDISNLQEANGSVGHSPSASAHFALNICYGDERALKYLSGIQNLDGGIPFAAPFDIFEPSWVLWNLSLTNLLFDEETLALCQPHLERLKKAWKPGLGISFAEHYTPVDCDDTSIVYHVMDSFNRSVDIQAILNYEEEDYFRCYALEANASVSTNIHVLGALRKAGYEASHPSVQKVIRLLQGISDVYWTDKWHTSPYYTTAHAVIACTGYMNDFVHRAVHWILQTQNQDGSWGYFNPTAEETAYCLQALSVWASQGGDIDISNVVLKKGASWLLDHLEPPYPPLWIGKCLYCPELVIRSAILSALLLVQQI